MDHSVSNVSSQGWVEHKPELKTEPAPTTEENHRATMPGAKIPGGLGNCLDNKAISYPLGSQAQRQLADPSLS